MRELKHIKPKLYSKNDGFVSLAMCTNCDSVSDSYTFSILSPCPLCGGRVALTGYGGKWIPEYEPYRTVLGFKRMREVGGKWEISKVKYNDYTIHSN